MPSLCFRWFLPVFLLLLSLSCGYGAEEAAVVQESHAAGRAGTLTGVNPNPSSSLPVTEQTLQGLKRIPAQNNALQMLLSSMENKSLGFISSIESLKTEALREISNSREIENRLCNNQGREHLFSVTFTLMGITIFSLFILLILSTFF